MTRRTNTDEAMAFIGENWIGPTGRLKCRRNQCEHLRRDGLAGAFGCITTLRWRRARRGGGGRRTRAAFFGDRF